MLDILLINMLLFTDASALYKSSSIELSGCFLAKFTIEIEYESAVYYYINKNIDLETRPSCPERVAYYCSFFI
jgi:hypothetical protein